MNSNIGFEAYVCVVIAAVYKPDDPETVSFAANLHALGDLQSVKGMMDSFSDERIAAEAEEKMGIKVTELRRLLLKLHLPLGEVSGHLTLAIKSLVPEASDEVVVKAGMNCLHVYMKAIADMANGKLTHTKMNIDDIDKMAAAAKVALN